MRAVARRLLPSTRHRNHLGALCRAQPIHIRQYTCSSKYCQARSAVIRPCTFTYLVVDKRLIDGLGAVPFFVRDARLVQYARQQRDVDRVVVGIWNGLLASAIHHERVFSSVDRATPPKRSESADHVFPRSLSLWGQCAYSTLRLMLATTGRSRSLCSILRISQSSRNHEVPSRIARGRRLMPRLR